jgi:hypothetical protein
VSSRALLLASIALGALSAPSAESAPTALIAGLRCADSVERQLELWAATGEVFRAPSGVDGRETFRFATVEIGRWVTLQKDPSLREAVLVESSAEGSKRVELDSDCRPRTTELELDRGSAPPAGFSDRDLKSLLDRDDRLVVFLWSPHMPLSAEALPEIEAAAREVGVPFVAVCDPSSDPHYVERVAAERGLEEAASRPLVSVELLMRNIAVHAPTILVFRDGRARAPLPGYRSRAAYLLYLRSIFGGTR